MSLKKALEDKLSDKELKFALAYFESMNATQSAVHAGYAKKSARVTASRLLTKANIQAYLAELKNELKQRSEVSIDHLVKELANIAFADIGEAFNENGQLKKIIDIPDNVRRAITSFTMSTTTTSLKLSSKRDAIETLLKYLGAFEKHNEQKQHSFDLSKIPTPLLRDIMKHLKE